MTEDDGRHDFDFLFGRWTVHNRALADRADPDATQWVEFETTSAVTGPVLGGLAHHDLITYAGGPAGPAWEGFTLRQFDPAERQWRIWWASSRNPGHLDPPLAGRFENGRGVFLGDDQVAGRPIAVRFTWTAGAQPQWQQEFSFDGEQTWIPNWTMTFRR